MGSTSNLHITSWNKRDIFLSNFIKLFSIQTKEKSCSAGTGYQPKCHVIYIGCDWSPANACLGFTLIKQRFLLNSFVKSGPFFALELSGTEKVPTNYWFIIFTGIIYGWAMNKSWFQLALSWLSFLGSSRGFPLPKMLLRWTSLANWLTGSLTVRLVRFSLGLLAKSSVISREGW